ncbi:hypothetical protein BSL78_20579 [Apostichopus japonicus]|uniref:Uncharacterized protein n=1 Tax=Stichopus japonicus TaxID=307972 RepID=A0A2G8K3H6_STIJA|nr:hypothetical protein BSL78_20579 [Apostichopus japonicus]
MAKTVRKDNGIASEEQAALVEVTETLTKSLREVCREGETAARGSAEHFLDDCVLGAKICSAYEKVMRRSSDVITAIEQLIINEYVCSHQDGWNNFLVDCDKTWQSPDDYCHVKKQQIRRLGPLNVKLTDARTGRLVDFLRWLKETGFEYDMLLDQERQIYKATGMGRTVAGGWNTGALKYYTEQTLAQKRLPEDFPDLKDDKEQMGGNIVLDGAGRYSMIYVSQASIDRPSVEKLLDVIR